MYVYIIYTDLVHYMVVNLSIPNRMSKNRVIPLGVTLTDTLDKELLLTKELLQRTLDIVFIHGKCGALPAKNLLSDGKTMRKKKGMLD